MKTTEIMARLQAKYPTEKEYLQAVQEVLESIEEVYNQHPEFEKAKIVERLVEPDRIFTFRVYRKNDLFYLPHFSLTLCGMQNKNR